MKMPGLKSMSVSDLIDLKDQVESLLSAKVSDARKDLEAQLAKLTGYGAAKRGRPAGVGKARGRGVLKGTKIAPKYVDPDTGLGWAGRGLQPKWLSSAIKSGKKLEDFAVDAAKAAMKKVTGKKRGRPAKKAA